MPLSADAQIHRLWVREGRLPLKRHGGAGWLVSQEPTDFANAGALCAIGGQKRRGRVRTTVRQLVRNPFLYLLLAVYLVSAYALTLYAKPFAETLIGLVLFGLLAALMGLVSWRVSPNEIRVKSPQREALLVVGYFVFWLVLNLALWPRLFSRSPWLANGISFWMLLVIVPALILLGRGYRLSDMGLTREHLRSNVRVTLLAGGVIGLVLLLLTPGGRFLRSGQAPPTTLALGLLASLGIAILTAGFHEEFFFRAVLQTRLSKALGSPFKGLFLATLIFSLYHLPFRLFVGDIWPSAGQIGYALALTFTEPVLGGLIMGVLWLRTRNLVAPVIIHALVLAISGLPMIMERLGLLP